MTVDNKSEPGFFRLQGPRIQVRWIVLRSAMYTAVFWTAAAVAGAWLFHAGLEAIAWSLLGVWAILAVPGLLVQIACIADAINYGFTGQLVLFPTFLRAEEVGGGAPRTETPKFVVWLSNLAAHTSPISALAMWCIVVLARAPKSAHIDIAIRDGTHRARRPRPEPVGALGELESRYLGGAVASV